MQNSKQKIKLTIQKKQDLYLKETFGLTDKELEQLKNGTYKISPYPSR